MSGLLLTPLALCVIISLSDVHFCLTPTFVFLFFFFFSLSLLHPHVAESTSWSGGRTPGTEWQRQKEEASGSRGGAETWGPLCCVSSQHSPLKPSLLPPKTAEAVLICQLLNVNKTPTLEVYCFPHFSSFALSFWTAVWACPQCDYNSSKQTDFFMTELEACGF